MRRHIDQTVRTRSFRARNETVERGAVTKSQKGKKNQLGQESVRMYQWKAIGQCSKGDSCSFSLDPASGNRRDQRQEGQSSSPAPNAKAQTDGKRPSRSSGRREESPSATRGARFCAEISCGESLCIRHGILGVLPCVSITRLNQDKCRFRHVEADGQPSRKSKKSGANGSLALLKKSIQSGCVSQDSTERRKTGIKSCRQILQGHVAPHKNSGRKGSIARRHSRE